MDSSTVIWIVIAILVVLAVVALFLWRSRGQEGAHRAKAAEIRRDGRGARPAPARAGGRGDPDPRRGPAGRGRRTAATARGRAARDTGRRPRPGRRRGALGSATSSSAWPTCTTRTCAPTRTGNRIDGRGRPRDRRARPRAGQRHHRERVRPATTERSTAPRPVGRRHGRRATPPPAVRDDVRRPSTRTPTLRRGCRPARPAWERPDRPPRLTCSPRVRTWSPARPRAHSAVGGAGVRLVEQLGHRDGVRVGEEHLDGREGLPPPALPAPRPLRHRLADRLLVEHHAAARPPSAGWRRSAPSPRPGSSGSRGAARSTTSGRSSARRRTSSGVMRDHRPRARRRR